MQKCYFYRCDDNSTLMSRSGNLCINRQVCTQSYINLDGSTSTCPVVFTLDMNQNMRCSVILTCGSCMKMEIQSFSLVRFGWPIWHLETTPQRMNQTNTIGLCRNHCGQLTLWKSTWTEDAQKKSRVYATVCWAVLAGFYRHVILENEPWT